MLGQFGCKVKNFEEELLAELVTDVLNTLKLTLMINFAKCFPKKKKFSHCYQQQSLVTGIWTTFKSCSSNGDFA